MQMKRLYDADKKMVGVKIVHLSPGRQHFRPELFMSSLAAGWASMVDNKYVIHNTGGDDAVFTVVSKPGYYCCHDEEPLANEVLAKAHVATQHAGVASPDKQNPSGYRKQNFYHCNKEN